MARKITISVSDDLAELIEAQAKARGVASVDECASLILAETLADIPRIPADRNALEAELLKGMEGPGIIPDAEYWERKKAELIARHTRNKAG
jgi:hypothetical protein